MNNDNCITEQVLKKIMSEKFKYLLMTAKHITGRQDVAEDCAMMAIIAMWERRTDFLSEQNATAFLYVVVKNFAFNELRNAKLASNKLGDLKLVEQYSIDAELEYKSIIDRAIKKVKLKFSKRCTNIFINHTLGLSNKEISDKFGYKYQTVRNVKSSILSFLKRNYSIQ